LQFKRKLSWNPSGCFLRKEAFFARTEERERENEAGLLITPLRDLSSIPPQSEVLSHLTARKVSFYKINLKEP
jgi:hypothetical protein